MKTKLLLTGVLSATLLLGACGNEENKTESQDKKSESVEKKKEAPKKSEDKKDTDKQDNESTEQTEQVATEELQSQEQQTQQVEQPENENYANRDDEFYNSLTDEEFAEMKDNAKTAWEEEDYENMPNGDAMFDMPGTEELSEEDVAEAEKEALREKYDGGLSSGEIQTKHAIEQGYYDGDNADEVMSEIEKSEQEIADGKYDQYK